MGRGLRHWLLCVVLAGCAQGHTVDDDAGPQSEGGFDAGRGDAGSPDADASTDAGRPDAGGSDARPTDSGPPQDAGPSDGSTDAGPECTDGSECPSGRCEEGACVPPPTDCQQLLSDDATAETGRHLIDPDGPGGAAAFEAWCDMEFDSGGWTLIGTVANDGTRRWNTYSVFVDDSTLGELDTITEDFKSEAWPSVAGQDLLVRTDEYAVGWADVLDDSTLADWIAAGYDDTSCSTSFVGGRPSWAEGLTAEQIDIFDLVVRALDDNSVACFPNGNENALLTLTLQDCCWTNGLGNTPMGFDAWDEHDLSLLSTANLTRGSCTAGTYPCNPRGYWNVGSSCYDTSCKVAWAQVYVR